MPRLVLADSAPRQQWALLDVDSIHEATVQNIEASTFKTDDGEKTNFSWTFLIHTPGEWENKKIWGNTSQVFNTNPNCKLRNWAQSVLSTELDAGYVLDTDDLIGRKVRIVVGHRKWTDRNTGEEREKQFVADILPPRNAPANPF